MKKQILFLQLPLLDNDTAGQRENFPFAALWLSHALSQHPEGEFWEVVPAPAEWDELDNFHLIQAIPESDAAAVAFTLCLWNVERAVRLAGLIRNTNPEIYLMAGGPEVSDDHPFLLDSCFDVLVTGEGEAVFPEFLKGVRGGKMPVYDNVLLSSSRGWKRGRNPPPQIELTSVQVPVDMLKPCIQARPSVYIETSRGCPLTCTYCRYHHLQEGVRALSAEAAADRVQQLRNAGAWEIRFVDPTFNARADFTRLLERLAEINADRKLGFFAELRADTLTPEQAVLLAKANFVDIEVGVQSTDPKVLRAIRRPANIAQVERGIRLLTGAGVHVTLDLMYGLPEQTFDDVVNGIEWARSLGPNIDIQCMQTLLLPGTDLREQAAQYNIKSIPLPPYGVLSTSALSEKEIAEIETMLHNSPDIPADMMTPRLIGYTLEGLFKEKFKINVAELDDPEFIPPGFQSRRTLIIQGRNLDAHREAICRLIERTAVCEPDMLWQFVLSPETEEPLELLVAMIETLYKQPQHLLDRYASTDLFGLIASRRIFVRLTKSRNYDPAWRKQVGELLERHFM
ncbi:MAG: B12-binding domain-containing radical SAM protein [Kiritimatiellales bacterium]